MGFDSPCKNAKLNERFDTWSETLKIGDRLKTLATGHLQYQSVKRWGEQTKPPTLPMTMRSSPLGGALTGGGTLTYAIDLHSTQTQQKAPARHEKRSNTQRQTLRSQPKNRPRKQPAMRHTTRLLHPHSNNRRPHHRIDRGRFKRA